MKGKLILEGTILGMPKSILLLEVTKMRGQKCATLINSMIRKVKCFANSLTSLMVKEHPLTLSKISETNICYGLFIPNISLQNMYICFDY